MRTKDKVDKAEVTNTGVILTSVGVCIAIR